MASVTRDSSGRSRIQFMNRAGERKTISLPGSYSQRAVESVVRHVGRMVASAMTGEPLPRETAGWLADLPEGLRKKLVAVGLLQPEKKTTVSEYLTRWLQAKEDSGHSPNSVRAWGQTVSELVELLGPRKLVTLTRADAEGYREAMLKRNLRPTTVHKRLNHARQMMADAIAQNEMTANPFAHVKQRQGDPSERRAYVPIADIEKVIEQCPNAHWRLLVALARYGGLRMPSEPFALTWGDVDWARDRITVTSPKTAAKGKPYRVIPLFALLRPHLERCFEIAEEGSVFVFPDSFRGRTNLRTGLTKLVRRAGLEPWPRIWHSLRASCESDLAAAFPLATVAKWLGNTPSIALRHYVDPTDSAFEQARTWRPFPEETVAPTVALVVSPGATQGTEPSGPERKEESVTPCGEASFASAFLSVPPDAERKGKTLRERIAPAHLEDSRQKTHFSLDPVAPGGALAQILAILDLLTPDERAALLAHLQAGSA